MKNFIRLNLILFGVILVSGCSLPYNKQSVTENEQTPSSETTTEQPAENSPNNGLANPASVNCVNNGGQLIIKNRASLGEYGVCFFEDNRQCEEWALLRGDCPVGGLKVTGYITDAAVYCAITGGEYLIKSESNAPEEQGDCKFKNNKICDAGEYYQGTCGQDSAADNNATSSESLIASAVYKCKEDKTISASFYKNYVDLKLSDGRTLKLNQTISASGARYANEDEAFIFWNKGDTAFIEESSKLSFADCAESK